MRNNEQETHRHVVCVCVCVCVCVYDVIQVNKRCLIMSCQVMNLLQQLYLLHIFVRSAVTELQKTFCLGSASSVKERT